VLDGLDFERYRPGVVIVENLFADRGYRRAMRRRGYVRWRHLAPNEVYVEPRRLGRLERLRHR
jgi:hypothetical protein